MHIPNGLIAKTNVNKVKPLGVRHGYPDLMLCIPSGDFHALFIELKRPSADLARAVRRDQVEIINQLNTRNYKAIALNTFESIVEAITNYMAKSRRI